MTTTLTKTFGETLNTLRKERKLTVEKLATLADVPATLISGLQNNYRRVGENNARRLGQALGLSGNNLTTFVYDAINTCSDKVLVESKPYPAEVLNLLAGELKASGISASDLNKCILHPTLNDGQKPNAIAYCKDGHSALIEVKVIKR